MESSADFQQLVMEGLRSAQELQKTAQQELKKQGKNEDLEPLFGPLNSAFHSAVKSLTSEEQYNTVILGNNGDGKTFLENVLLRSTVVSEHKYTTMNQGIALPETAALKHARRLLEDSCVKRLKDASHIDQKLALLQKVEIMFKLFTDESTER